MSDRTGCFVALALWVVWVGFCALLVNISPWDGLDRVITGVGILGNLAFLGLPGVLKEI